MAEYTNLQSLETTKTGDIILYNKDTMIDFKSRVVKITILGKTVREYTYSSYGYGGKTEFILSPLKNMIFYYTPKFGSSLCYSEINPYYRIAVGGDAGGYSMGTNYTACGGHGGGLIGGSGEVSGYQKGDFDYSPASGGTQLSGGTFNKRLVDGNYTDSIGTFGTGGPKGSSGTSYFSGKGGDGWYGGAGGQGNTVGSAYSTCYGAGGGSGFLIGKSTLDYPSGYMGDDDTLIESLENMISNNYVITQGAAGTSNSSNSVMIVEVLAEAILYHNGETFVDCFVNYNTGIEWKKCTAKYYHNNEWIDIGGN